MAAQGGLQLRVSSGASGRDKRYAGGAEPPGAPTDRSALVWIADLVSFRVVQRGRGEVELGGLFQARPVPPLGFQGSKARGRVLGAPRCCVEK